MSTRSFDHVDIDNEKDVAMFTEDTKTTHSVDQELPELLRDLSESERHALEKKLVRTIDLRLLPLLVLMYIMNYLDRNNIASARLAGKIGMEKELGMTSTQFSVCCSSSILSQTQADITTTDLCQHSLRRLYHHASSIQPDPKQDGQACDLPSICHDSLGYHLGIRCRSPLL